MKTLYIILILLCAFSVTHAQIFLKPSPGGYGNIDNRRSVDSVFYYPTGCGVPTDSTWLFSEQNGGVAQKLNKFAIYGDTCDAGLTYIWNPKTKTWSPVGSGGGSGTVTSVIISNDSVYYTTSSGSIFVFLAVQHSDSTIIFITPTQLADSVSVRLKYSDSVVKYITPTEFATKVNVSDSVTKYVTPTQLAVNLALKVNYSDSAAVYYSKYRSDTSRTNIYAAIGLKIANAAGVSFIGVGTYAGRPIVGNGIWYATDSTSFFLINGAVAVNMTIVYNVAFVAKGGPGDTSYVYGIGNKIYVAAQRDSIDWHTIINADSSRTHYVQAHDTATANALQSKYRSDTARSNIYAALGLRLQSIKRSADSVYGCYGPTNTLCVFAFFDSVGGGSGGITQLFGKPPFNVLGTDTGYVDTTQTATSGAHLVSQNMIYLAHRIEFIDSIPGTTYQNDRLIGSSILNINIGGVDVGQIANTNAYYTFNTNAGSFQLYNDTLQYLDRVIILYKRPFVDSSTYSQTIGLIASANSFSNLNAFFNNSAANAYSVIGTQIYMRSLPGFTMWSDQGDCLDYNLYDNDEQAYFEETVRIGSQGDGLGFGIKFGPGQADGGAGSYNSIFATLNITTLTVPKLYIWNQQVVIDSATFSGTISVGDSIKMRLTRNKGTFTEQVTDLNTSVTASNTATFNYTYPGNFILPVTGRWGIAKFGSGIDTLRSFTLFSNSVRSPKVAFIGDSKTTGYWAGSQSGRFAEIVGANGAYQPFAVYASPGDRTQDCLNSIYYVVTYVHPKNVIINMGRNDLSSFGLPFCAQCQFNYEKIVGLLEGSGAKIIHLLPIPETAIPNQSSLNSFIIGQWGTWNTIDPSTSFVTGSMLAADGTHPNSSGESTIATDIINAKKIH